SFMFSENQAFNQNISSWDVSSVTNMRRMFRLSGPFNQNLGSWNVNNVTDCNGFCYSTPNWTSTKPSFSNCGETECE
ncbi:MAG: BspA family leucine-rich repeat surface protein, partial [Flavobacteriales bacterium]|nr:BspA family leucine-rich repeat surface protein [Flavobacteriales bacterium]